MLQKIYGPKILDRVKGVTSDIMFLGVAGTLGYFILLPVAKFILGLVVGVFFTGLALSMMVVLTIAIIWGIYEITHAGRRK